jgi:6-phospho-3-hexuloisomerase
MTSETNNITNLKDVFAGQIKAIEALSQKIDTDVANRLVEMMLKANRIFITGQGRSGLIAQCLATRLAQMDFSVNVPGHSTCQKIEAGDLMIAISCSGKTATTTQFAKVSKQAGAKVAVMTTVPQSTLADMTDEIILFPSNLEDCPYAVGPNNNSMFEQAVMLYMDALVYVLLERKSIPKSIIVEQHTNLE